MSRDASQAASDASNSPFGKPSTQLGVSGTNPAHPDQGPELLFFRTNFLLGMIVCLRHRNVPFVSSEREHRPLKCTALQDLSLHGPACVNPFPSISKGNAHL
jgi:hypothetical protein